MDEEKKINLRLVIPKSLHSSFKQYCKRQRRTIQAQIEILMENAIFEESTYTAHLAHKNVHFIAHDTINTHLGHKNVSNNGTTHYSQASQNTEAEYHENPEKSNVVVTTNKETNLEKTGAFAQERNQTTQSNPKNGQIKSEQLSQTFAVETEKQENNQTNKSVENSQNFPDSQLASSNGNEYQKVEIENNLENPNSHLADGDNTSDAQKSVDEQVDALADKYPGLGLHQALGREKIKNLQIDEEVIRTFIRKIKPTTETRLNQTEMGYRLGYSHGRNLGGQLSSGKFEGSCKKKDPERLIWEVCYSSEGDRYFRISSKTGDSADDVEKNSQAVPNDNEKSEKLSRKQKYYNSPEKIKYYQELEILPDTELKQVELAARFGYRQSTSISVKASERDLSTEDFEVWTASKDPQNIRWREVEGDKGKTYRPIFI